MIKRITQILTRRRAQDLIWPRDTAIYPNMMTYDIRMVTISDLDSRFNSSSIDRSDVNAMSINAGFLVAVQFFIKLIKLKSNSV